MFSLLSGFFSLTITLVVVVFAVSNRHMIDVFYLPGEFAGQLPLFAVALGLMALGFFFGAIAVWFNFAHVRRERRQQKRILKRLKKEVEQLKRPQSSSKANALMPDSDFFPAIPDIQKQK